MRTSTWLILTPLPSKSARKAQWVKVDLVCFILFKKLIIKFCTKNLALLLRSSKSRMWVCARHANDHASLLSFREIRSQRSSGCNLRWQFSLCGAFRHIDFAGGGAGRRIDKSAWAWQLRGRTEAWYAGTSRVNVFFCSPTAAKLPRKLSINLLLIKNLFCYLRLAFASPPCVSWGGSM